VGNISVKDDSRPLNLSVVDKSKYLWYFISAIVFIILIVIYLALDFSGLMPEDSTNAMLTSDTLSIFSTWVFFIASVLGLIKSKNLNIRDGIIAFTASSLFYLTAEVTWTIYNFALNVEVPYPSIADIFYVMGAIAFILALYLVKKGLSNKPKIDLTIILVIVLGSALLTGLLLLSTVVLSGNPIGVSTVLDVTYPVLDYISLVLVISLLMVSVGRSVAEAQIILTAGVIITAVSDILFSFATALGLYTGGSLIDFMFTIGYLLFAISVWRYVALTREDILKDRISKIKKKVTV
jgi:hypothetical protein